jgi:hypothetical protein
VLIENQMDFCREIHRIPENEEEKELNLAAKEG